MGGKLTVAVPFLLATVYYLFTPVLSALTEDRIKQYFANALLQWRGPQGAATPDHLSPASVARICDWAADAPQLVPTILLPLAGVLFAVAASRDIAVAIAAVTSIIVSVGALWIYHQNPIRYSARRFIMGRYTIVASLGIVLNLVATAAVLYLPASQPSQTNPTPPQPTTSPTAVNR